MTLSVLITKNAYRVLEIFAGSSFDVVHNAASRQRRQITLGLSEIGSNIFGLDKFQIAEGDIRTAIGTLENPLQRLRNNCFWFYAEDRIFFNSIPWLQAADKNLLIKHDEILKELISLSIKQDIIDNRQSWIDQLNAWSTLIQNDDFWYAVLKMEEESGFEPTIIFSDIEAVKLENTKTLAEPLLTEAHNALNKNNKQKTYEIISILAELISAQNWVEDAIDEVLASPTSKISEYCKYFESELTSKIEREPDKSQLNNQKCENELKYYRDNIVPALNELLELVPRESLIATQNIELVANCLNTIATDHTWADQFIKAEELTQEAIQLASGPLAEFKFQQNFENLKESADIQRRIQARDKRWGIMKPVKSAPSLFWFYGFGVNVYWRFSEDKETDTYIKIYYFTAFFIPLFPICRYRVKDTEGGGYYFIGKYPLSLFDKWHLGVSAIICLAIVGSNIWDSNKSKELKFNGTPSIAYDAQYSKKQQLATLKTLIDSGRRELSSLEIKLKPIE